MFLTKISTDITKLFRDFSLFSESRHTFAFETSTKPVSSPTAGHGGADGARLSRQSKMIVKQKKK